MSKVTEERKWGDVTLSVDEPRSVCQTFSIDSGHFQTYYMTSYSNKNLLIMLPDVPNRYVHFQKQKQKKTTESDVKNGDKNEIFDCGEFSYVNPADDFPRTPLKRLFQSPNSCFVVPNSNYSRSLAYS